jgi:hypothetical protein
MRAEIDMFSGRPNPAWELTPEEAAELNTRTRTTTAAEPISASVPEGVLGYRGVVVTRAESEVEAPDSVRVYAGVVTVQRGDRVAQYPDQLDIESWLLDRARAHGCGALVDQLRKH